MRMKGKKLRRGMFGDDDQKDAEKRKMLLPLLSLSSHVSMSCVCPPSFSLFLFLACFSSVFRPPP